MRAIRVFELAKALGATNKHILLQFNTGGYNIKSHMNILSEVEIEFMLTKYPDVTIEEVEQRIIRTEKKKHPVTTPWHADENPWALNRLRLRAKRPGYRVRFVRKDKVEIKEHQGWKIADKRDYGYTLQDKGDSPDGTTVVRRELILMELPEELALQRDAFMEHKTRMRSRTTAEIANEGQSVKHGIHAERQPEHRLRMEETVKPKVDHAE
jgi:hypothetical protein